jgi:hypothetical protein
MKPIDAIATATARAEMVERAYNLWAGSRKISESALPKGMGYTLRETVRRVLAGEPNVEQAAEIVTNKIIEEEILRFHTFSSLRNVLRAILVESPESLIEVEVVGFDFHKRQVKVRVLEKHTPSADIRQLFEDLNGLEKLEIKSQVVSKPLMTFIRRAFKERKSWPLAVSDVQALFPNSLAEEQWKNLKNRPNTILEAKYRGRTVDLNKVIRNATGSRKKFHVFVTHPETGKVVKVQFGDPNMRVRKNNPARAKSFRARHGCDDVNFKSDRHRPKYWSCKAPQAKGRGIW